MVDGVAVLMDGLPIVITTSIDVTESYPLSGLSQSFPVTVGQAPVLTSSQPFPLIGQQAFPLGGQTQSFPMG